MNKIAKHIFSVIGLASVLLFCVSAANMTSGPNTASRVFSEPLSMVFQGLVLIGVGSLIKGRSNG